MYIIYILRIKLYNFIKLVKKILFYINKKIISSKIYIYNFTKLIKKFLI